MKKHLAYLQPAVLILFVIMFENRFLFKESSNCLVVYWEALCSAAGVFVPGLWIVGIVIIWDLIREKSFKHCIIILCLNIFISFFYDGIYVFTHLGRKDNRYIPKTIQDAKEKGAFICEYSQVNRVVLQDSIEITVAEAFVCDYCYYDDNDIIYTSQRMPKYFIAYLNNREQLEKLPEKLYFENSHYSIDELWWPHIEVDTLTGMPPAEIILRIRQDVTNEDGLLNEIYVDSIRFVRIKE